jgi:hypothetical protein
VIWKPNGLFFKMAQLVAARKPETKLIIGNQGGGRSSKTYDFFHLLAWICDHNRHKKLEIYIFRDTLTACKEHALKDFRECLQIIGIWNENNLRSVDNKPNYNLFGQTIKFRGIEDGSTEHKEASRSDIIFVNEILSGVSKENFDNWLRRCEALVVADWNPKYTDHWFFDFEKRSDCVFTYTTYKNNRHLKDSIRSEFEGYQPVAYSEIGRELKKQDRNIHLYDCDKNPIGFTGEQIVEYKRTLKNEAAGTADVYQWKVYGLGERANREGLVFPEVTYVDDFPEDIEQFGYGLDFGSAHPTVIVKGGIRRKLPKPDLFLKKLYYSPCDTSTQVIDAVRSLGITGHIWCDTNMDNTNTGIGWVSDMRRSGINALLTKKFPGSRAYWISMLKKYNIHMVRDPDFKREQENFCYRVVDGVQLSETIDKYDDCWSASGYLTVGDFRI